MEKICIFNGDMSRSGGTERCTANLANELIKRNYEVQILDYNNLHDECFYQLDKRIELYHLRGTGVLNGIMRMFSYCKREKITVMINVECALGIYTVPVCKALGIKNIIWEHGNFYQKQFKRIDLVRKFEIWLSDYYITLTERDKKNFQEHFSGHCKLECIYNSISIPKDLPIYDQSSRIILSVGVVRKIKGFDILVEVAAKVFKKHPDWQWHIYGKVDDASPYVKALRQKIEKLELEDRLLLKGITTDISSCYKMASMCVMTSRMEGLPMTLLEAKSYKLPIVSFDIMTGPSEIIDDSLNGYLIEPYDTEKMADKINQLIEDRELRKQFSDYAYTGIEKFDLEKIMDKWLNIIGG